MTVKKRAGWAGVVFFFCLAIAAAQDDSEYNVSYVCHIWFSIIVCVIWHTPDAYAYLSLISTYSHSCCSQEVEGGWQAKVRHVGEIRGTAARAHTPWKRDELAMQHRYYFYLSGADVLRLHSQEGAESSILLSAKPYRRHFQFGHILLVDQIQI